MGYNVDVYLDDVWVKTYYNVRADSEADAQEYVQEVLMGLDFSVEPNE
jgi:hypothetical protein